MDLETLKFIIQSVDQEPKLDDDPWYIVCMNWWKQASKALLDGHSQLEDLDNLELVENYSNKQDNLEVENYSNEDKFKLSKKLTEKIDFVIIPKKSWDLILK